MMKKIAAVLLLGAVMDLQGCGASCDDPEAVATCISEALDGIYAIGGDQEAMCAMNAEAAACVPKACCESTNEGKGMTFAEGLTYTVYDCPDITNPCA